MKKTLLIPMFAALLVGCGDNTETVSPPDSTPAGQIELAINTPQEPVISEKVLTTEYVGRIEFEGDNGKDLAALVPASIKAEWRALQTSPANLADLHQRIKASVVAEAADAAPMSFRTSTVIVGLSEAHPSAVSAEVLHSGVTSIEQNGKAMGVQSDLVWDDANQHYKITIQPFGFVAEDITVTARKNVREELTYNEPVPVKGELIGNVFHLENTSGDDGSYHYVLVNATNAATGERYAFYGPDNFQTYK